MYKNSAHNCCDDKMCRETGVPGFSMHWSGLVSSRRRLVFLRFFLMIRLITIENVHDLPSFCDELSIGVREIRALALVLGEVSASGLFAEGTEN